MRIHIYRILNKKGLCACILKRSVTANTQNIFGRKSKCMHMYKKKNANTQKSVIF